MRNSTEYIPNHNHVRFFVKTWFSRHLPNRKEVVEGYLKRKDLFVLQWEVGNTFVLKGVVGWCYGAG